jgi:hypothetical protein
MAGKSTQRVLEHGEDSVWLITDLAVQVNLAQICSQLTGVVGFATWISLANREFLPRQAFSHLGLVRP